MTTNDLLEVVRHYQRSIERHQEDESRLLHCITKLYNLPIKVEHLQETGIGKTVNSLRKCNGEVSVAAKTLVTKWKAMVAAEEEEPLDSSANIATTTSNKELEHGNQKNNARSSSDEDHDENKRSNTAATTSGKEQRSHHSSGSSKTSDHIAHKHSSSSRHRDHNSSSSKSHKDERSDKQDFRENKNQHQTQSKQNDKHHHSSRSSSEKRKEEKRHNGEKKPKENHVSVNSNSQSKSEEDNIGSHNQSNISNKKHHEKKHRSSKHDDKSDSKSKEKKNKSHKSSKHEKHDREKSTKTSSSSTSKEKSESGSKRSRNEDDETSPKPKIPKLKGNTNPNGVVDNDEDKVDANTDGFDSSMGANFADVLGMLSMPMSNKKNKKSSAVNKTKNITNINSQTSTKKLESKSLEKASTSTSSSTSTSTSATSSQKENGYKSTSNSTTTRKPDLLSSTAKLEPLDPNLALELPSITTNYKPLPLNQTVMDVVFNGTGASTSSGTLSQTAGYKPSTSRTFDESEALAQGISSKTMRTKIYSGAKPGQIMQVPSLFDLCIRVLQKNIDALEYTGGVPFDVLRPVLERATPQQLLIFEDYNPYLMEDSDELWQRHVQRHYRTQRRQEMETWREMFMRCQEEKEHRLSVLAESIKQSQKIHEAPVRKTQLAFVDSLAKPPRNILRKQEQFGTRSKLTATPAARVAALSSVTPNAAKPGDTRLRALATGRDTAQIAAAPMRPKKAPLMAKTLQLMRGRHKR